MTFSQIPLLACLERLSLHTCRQPAGGQDVPLTLADIPPGSQAEIAAFLEGLSDERQAHLRAYGLSAGSRVQVKQHQPVTVIQVDHTELAMESALARKIRVERRA